MPPPVLLRLFRVLHDSVNPAISASGKMSRVAAFLIYAGVGTWMLIPGDLLASVSRTGRIAGGMAVLAVLFLARAYKLQEHVESLDVSIVLIRDKAGLIGLLQDGLQHARAAVYITANERVANAAQIARMWRADMQRILVDQAGKNEWMKYANAKARGSPLLRDDMNGQQRDEVLRLQGQIDAIEDLISRVHAEATEEAVRFPRQSTGGQQSRPASRG